MEERKKTAIDKVGEFNSEQKQVIAVHSALVADLDGVREEIM